MPKTLVIEAKNLCKHFPRASQDIVRAVEQASFTLEAGEVLGIVGESGSGKTTLGLMAAGLLPPTAGAVRWFDGVDPYAFGQTERRRWRRRVQWIPQMPSSSLHPRHTVSVTLAEPLIAHGIVKGKAALDERISALLQATGLSPDLRKRHARELSLGQQQRLAIARALTVAPELLICDEITSSLDACLQAQLVGLLREMQETLRMSCLFITHNLALARWLCHRVGIMYQGKIIETGRCDEIFAQPQHPYTAALLEAVRLR